VTEDGIYAILGLMMLMGIVQKPTLNSYVSRDDFQRHLTLYRLVKVKALILTHRPQIPSPAGLRWSSVNCLPTRLRDNHLIEKIPSTGKKAKPQENVPLAQFRRREKNLLVVKQGIALNTVSRNSIPK
jgi:hypothetical protein